MSLSTAARRRRYHALSIATSARTAPPGRGAGVWPIAPVVWGSAACGAWLGLGCRWQTAVESAQVLAGVVQYPMHNPFYLYHVKTWTLLHQLPAAGLALGLSESPLCLALGAFAGGLSFVAVALLTLALSQQRWLALAVPLLMFATGTYLETSGVYPLRMLSNRTWAIYGVVGASWTLLTWSLLALRRWRVGGLCLGLAPAIHPLLGAWCVGLGMAALCSFTGLRRDSFRRMGRWLALGAVMSVCSFALQQYWMRGTPTISSAMAADYISAYVNGWDTHRRPFPLTNPSILLAVATVALGCAAWFGRPKLSRQSAEAFAGSQDIGPVFLPRVLGLSSAIALLGCVATHFPDHLPSVVLSAMPGRFINLTVLAFPAIVWGALAFACPPSIGRLAQAGLACVCGLRLLHGAGWVYLPVTWPLFVACALLCILCLVRRRSEGSVEERAKLTGRLGQRCWPWFAVAYFIAGCVWVIVLGAAAGLTFGAWGAGAMLVWMALDLRPQHETNRGDAQERMPRISFSIQRNWAAYPHRPVVRYGAIAAIAAVVFAGAAVRARSSLADMKDWTNDPFFAALHQGEGAVAIVAGVSSTQLRGRRPVLLEVSSLNQLPYVPESGPEMNRILRRVYGENLFAGGPRGGKRRPGLDPQAARKLWESRDIGAWRRLSKEFGFQHVMAYRKWRLRLPVTAKNREFTLYCIPTSNGSR